MSNLQAPRGTHDIFGPDAIKYQYIHDIFRQTCEQYSFSFISTPIFESLQVFDRTLGEVSDIVSKEMYVFEDRGGDRMSLRPEGTAGVVRAFLSNSLQRETPLKFWYSGPMFRYERPQKGRYRQFHQVGVEALGIDNPLADAEVISLGFEIFRKLKLTEKIKLEINSLGSATDRQKYRQILVDYYNKFQSQLSEDSRKRLLLNPMRILDSKDPQDIKINIEAPKLADHLSEDSRKKFELVQDLLKAKNYAFTINPSLVRGLDYYNDLVFEFKTDTLGAQDAVLSGGRYDGLVETMGGQATPGVGFAAGVERLMLMLDQYPEVTRPVVFVALGVDAEKLAFQTGEALRMSGVTVEHAYSGNIGKRMKRATKLNAKWVVIFGDEEVKNKTATIKNFDTGNQENVSLSDLLAKIS